MDIRELIEDVLAEMQRPVDLCSCPSPLVKEPDTNYWCECHRCRRPIPYTAVIEGLATIVSRVQ